MAKGFSLADQLFNAEKLAYLAGLFEAAAPSFDRAGFERAVMARLPALELKARIDWIAGCLDAALPGPFEDLAGLILGALPPPCDPELSDDDFGDFIFAPLGELVVRRGIDAPEVSLDVLEEVTQRFSMEYAIRPFLNAWEDAVFARMAVWVQHSHYHVRRLVSEGTRPKLPWGKKINVNPDRAMALLDVLHADKTRFVTRSVANHMNDLSKLMPGATMDRLEAWGKLGAQTEREFDWMRKHSLRTLVKQGDARVMALLGYRADAPVSLTSLALDRNSVAQGEKIRFDVVLSAPEKTPVLVDYVLEFYRGEAQSPRRKVMKLGQGVVAPDAPLVLHKQYRVPLDATTLKVTPGPHRIEIQVNGRIIGAVGFEVT